MTVPRPQCWPAAWEWSLLKCCCSCTQSFYLDTWNNNWTNQPVGRELLLHRGGWGENNCKMTHFRLFFATFWFLLLLFSSSSSLPSRLHSSDSHCSPLTDRLPEEALFSRPSASSAGGMLTDLGPRGRGLCQRSPTKWLHSIAVHHTSSKPSLHYFISSMPYVLHVVHQLQP